MVHASEPQFKQLQKRCLKKCSGLDGIWTQASQVIVGRMLQTTEPWAGSKTQILEIRALFSAVNP